MRKFLFFFTSLLLVGVLSCQQNHSSEQHIFIIATNDIHASIDAMPKLATLVKEYEQQGEVLLIDSGDRVSGNAYVDDALLPGTPIIELMNGIGYDVATLGNHEFDKGSDVLNTMIATANFDILCANVKGSNGATTPLPYAIMDICDITIGFVGVVDTDNDGRPLGGASAYTNYAFTPDIESAIAMGKELASQCDLTILLSHMGLEQDTELALQCDYYDWIAGGHSHDLVCSTTSSTHISQNNKNLRYVTIADITIHNKEITNVYYEQLSTTEITPDQATAMLVDTIKASDPELNSIVGYANEPATKEGVSNFTIAALANYPYSDNFVPEITLYHYGGIRLDSIAEGDIRKVDILNNDPFGSTIYIGTMTPDQLSDFILRKYNNGTAEHPDKESHYPYFRSNTPYTIIVDEKGDATDVVFNLEARPYCIAMCNYIAENYIDSDIVATQLQPTEISVREAMLHHIATFSDRGLNPDNHCYQTEEKAK